MLYRRWTLRTLLTSAPRILVSLGLGVGLLVGILSGGAHAGNGWRSVPSPNPDPNAINTRDYLQGVSCVSVSWCSAVGYYGGGHDVTLAEVWDGTSWAIVASANPSNLDSHLHGVSCLAEQVVRGGRRHRDAARPNRPSSRPGTAHPGRSFRARTTTRSRSVLQSVSCPSTTTCTAVGYSWINGIYSTLTESWDGLHWSIVRSPNIPGRNNLLQGVSCPSTSSCIAVGDTGGGSGEITLVESWNGTAWSILSSPNRSGRASELASVSCTSGSSCAAVGESSDYGSSETLAETWNGTVWKIVSSPNSSATMNALLSLVCRSPSWCTAVGYTSVGTRPAEPPPPERSLSRGTAEVGSGYRRQAARQRTICLVECRA